MFEVNTLKDVAQELEAQVVTDDTGWAIAYLKNAADETVDGYKLTDYGLSNLQNAVKYLEQAAFGGCNVQAQLDRLNESLNLQLQIRQEADQNERMTTMIAAGVDPMAALQAVQATDAIAAAKKAVQQREAAQAQQIATIYGYDKDGELVLTADFYCKDEDEARVMSRNLVSKEHFVVRYETQGETFGFAVGYDQPQPQQAPEDGVKGWTERGIAKLRAEAPANIERDRAREARQATGLRLDPIALLGAILTALLIFLGSLGAGEAQARDWGAYKAISGQQVQIARNDHAAFCHIKGQGVRQLDSRRDTAQDCVSGPRKAQDGQDSPSKAQPAISQQEAACKRAGKVWVDPYVRQGSPVSGYCRSYPSDRDSVDRGMGNSLAGNKVVVDISRTRYQSELRAAAAEINRLPGPNVVFSRSNPTLIASDVACSRDFVGRYEFGPGVDDLFFSVCEMRRLPQSERTGTALHELWHSFGFDHNRDPNSIMYEDTSGTEHLGPRDLAEWKAAFGKGSKPQPKPAAAPGPAPAAAGGVVGPRPWPFPQSASDIAEKRLEALVKKYGDSASYISVKVTTSYSEGR